MNCRPQTRLGCIFGGLKIQTILLSYCTIRTYTRRCTPLSRHKSKTSFTSPLGSNVLGCRYLVCLQYTKYKLSTDFPIRLPFGRIVNFGMYALNSKMYVFLYRVEYKISKLVEFEYTVHTHLKTYTCGFCLRRVPTFLFLCAAVQVVLSFLFYSLYYLAGGNAKKKILIVNGIKKREKNSFQHTNDIATL